jgi:hypothetical protein
MSSRTRPDHRGHLIGRPILGALAPFVSVGCGVHYGRRQGSDVQDFELRVQVGVPEPNQFRGPDEVAEFDNPPSPTAAQRAAHDDAATQVVCRQPKASRPAGVVCRSR